MEHFLWNMICDGFLISNTFIRISLRMLVVEYSSTSCTIKVNILEEG